MVRKIKEKAMDGFWRIALTILNTIPKQWDNRTISNSITRRKKKKKSRHRAISLFSISIFDLFLQSLQKGYVPK